MREVTNLFYRDLTDWKKISSYEFCFHDACGAMTALLASLFIPKNYEHVVAEAKNSFHQSKIRTSFEYRDLYHEAVDAYIYNYYLLINWWFN